MRNARPVQAYIASQRHEGWVLVKERYDDGGISGGHLDRPALQRLMDDVEAGRVIPDRRLQDRSADAVADGLCKAGRAA